jgi:hypothetical protein
MGREIGSEIGARDCDGEPRRADMRDLQIRTPRNKNLRDETAGPEADVQGDERVHQVRHAKSASASPILPHSARSIRELEQRVKM